jgi:asparagine synthase (glutamine-hydrolysing)
VCGITGWVDFGRDLKPERPVIEAMTSTMANRGPDAGGVWCSVHAGMGHRGLSVIDLEGGEQPMRAARGEDEVEVEVVLTFSGEVYNFTELRSELKSLGHQFRTRSDTEVQLAEALARDPRLTGSGVTIQLDA